MRILKYIISFFAILSVVFILGESAIQIAENTIHNTTANCEIKIDKNISDKEEIEEILEPLKSIKKSTSTVPFILKSEMITNDKEKINIYCDKEDESLIKNKFGLKSNTYKSLLTGNLEIQYHQFNELDIIDKFTNFHFIGNNSSCTEAIGIFGKNNEINDEYFPSGDFNNLKYIYIFLGVATVIVLISEIFYVENKKKAMIIKITLGSDRLGLILKEIAVNSLVYILTVLVSALICSFVNNVFDVTDKIIIFTVIIIIVNTLPYLSIVFCNYAKVLRGANMKKSILIIANVINSAVIATLVVTAASVYNKIDENMGYFTAESLFKNRDYSFCDFSLDVFKYADKYTLYNEEIYRQNYEKCKPIMLEGFYMGEEDEDFDVDNVNNNAVYANSNASEYLCSWIKGLDKSALKEDYTIIFYKNENEDKVIEQAKEKIMMTECGVDSYYNEKMKYKFSVNTLCLNDHYKIIAMNGNNDSSFEQLKDPVVIINNTPANKMQILPEYANRGSSYNLILYKANDNFLQNVQKKYNFDQVIVTNCSNHFYYYWRINKTVIVFLCAVTLLFMFMELLLNLFIIKNYFDINSKEICLQIVFGHSAIQRYAELVIRFVMYIILGLAASMVFLVYYNIAEWYVSAIIGIIMLAINLTVLFFYAKKIEGKNINAVIKGGAL